MSSCFFFFNVDSTNRSWQRRERRDTSGTIAHSEDSCLACFLLILLRLDQMIKERQSDRCLRFERSKVLLHGIVPEYWNNRNKSTSLWHPSFLSIATRRIASPSHHSMVIVTMDNLRLRSTTPRPQIPREYSKEDYLKMNKSLSITSTLKSSSSTQFPVLSKSTTHSYRYIPLEEAMMSSNLLNKYVDRHRYITIVSMKF